MNWKRKIVGAVGASALLLTVAGAPANAATVENEYPETPVTSEKLPIINTHHGSDHIKANVLNPRPVCNPFEDYRTVVYKATDKFSPVGTISTHNQSKTAIPLTQDLSRTQTISMSVNGDRTSTTSVNAGAEKDGGSFGIAQEISQSLGFSASYELSWNVGQTIGPYDVPAGHTGEATYGFRTINMTGTQQYCKSNGTWSTPTAWRAFVPLKNDVKVNVYDDAVDSYRPGKQS